MTFNSYIFVLAFLPLCLFGYFALNHFKLYRLGLVFLIGMSLWFYGYFNPKYLPIICSSVLINYIAYRALRRMGGTDENSRRLWKRKAVLWIALIFNLGMLGYFKYTDFFIENINKVFHADFPLRHILLPLGISFFTFQQISFIVDVYMDREGSIEYNFVEYAAYVTYFPQLVAGPIVTHDLLVPQMQDKRLKSLNPENLSRGIALFTLGLAKKVLLADVFGNLVTLGYQDVNALNSTTALLTILGYVFQLYFDFSGYSDMAIGLGWMMNIDLPVNFNSPYKSKSVTEFWTRWHMTLTAFLTKYVYFPLGGSRKGTLRTYLNIMIVFLLSGFWHGAGWTYIVWGLMHGLAQVLERLLKKLWSKLNPVFSWVLFFSFFVISLIYFRSATVAEANLFASRIFQLNFGPVSGEMAEVFLQTEWRLLTGIMPYASGIAAQFPNIYLALYFIFAFAVVLALPNAKYFAEKYAKKTWSSFLIAGLLVWCIFSFTGVSTFLYFNF